MTLRLGGSAAMSLALLITLFAAAGCNKEDSSTGTATPPPQSAQPAAPANKPIIPMAQMADWCPEHGVPESVCTRCNSSLVAAFKAKGDWDEKHNLPKSQCFACDPSLKDKFVAEYKAKFGKEPPAGHDSEKR